MQKARDIRGFHLPVAWPTTARACVRGNPEVNLLDYPDHFPVFRNLCIWWSELIIVSFKWKKGLSIKSLYRTVLSLTIGISVQQEDNLYVKTPNRRFLWEGKRQLIRTPQDVDGRDRISGVILAWAQPMCDAVTIKRWLSLAEPIPRMIPEYDAILFAARQLHM